jgi:hypothetical protein
MATMFAFDKMDFTAASGSVRRKDDNGYLHVSESHISRATVNPYYGKEIPGAADLGLLPDKVYKLFRDPDELKKAAPTFDNLPLMDKHIPLSSFNLDDPKIKEHLVGSTGTDAAFDDGFLDNSLVIFTQSAINDVEAKKKHELSCAYQYKPVMTPGVYNGEAYDGIMTNIKGNHVSLVPEGRAGHDVKVMDAKMAECSVLKTCDVQRISTAIGSDYYAVKVRRAMGLDAGGSVTIDPVKTYTMPRKEAKQEHVRLVAELEQPASKGVLKHEGEEQDKELKTKIEAKDTAKRKGVDPEEGKEKYGSVQFADPKNKKYPIDTPAHVASAASYFGMPKNRAKYSKEDQTTIDKRIRAAKWKFKIGESAESK